MVVLAWLARQPESLVGAVYNALLHQLQVKASAVLSRAVNRPHFGTISA